MMCVIRKYAVFTDGIPQKHRIEPFDGPDCHLIFPLCHVERSRDISMKSLFQSMESVPFSMCHFLTQSLSLRLLVNCCICSLKLITLRTLIVTEMSPKHFLAYAKNRTTNTYCIYAAVLLIPMQYSTYIVLYNEYD